MCQTKSVILLVEIFGVFAASIFLLFRWVGALVGLGLGLIA